MAPIQQSKSMRVYIQNIQHEYNTILWKKSIKLLGVNGHKKY